MQITRISPYTGKPNTLDINITQEQLQEWKSGKLIQKVMPHISADEREFLISGLYPGEFELLMLNEPEDE